MVSRASKSLSEYDMFSRLVFGLESRAYSLPAFLKSVSMTLTKDAFCMLQENLSPVLVTVNEPPFSWAWSKPNEKKIMSTAHAINGRALFTVVSSVRFRELLPNKCSRQRRTSNAGKKTNDEAKHFFINSLDL